MLEFIDLTDLTNLSNAIIYDNVSLLNLDMRNIAISFGSACASGTAKASPVLLSIGLNEDIANKTVRITIGKHIAENDIHSLVDALKGIIIK